MSKKLPPRFEKHFWKKPTKPKGTRYRVELLLSAGERMPHWPTSDRSYDHDYEEDEDNPETEGQLPECQCLSLKKINELVKEHGLDENKVFFTASFDEDYLIVEAVHIRKMTEEDKEEEHKANLAAWEEQEEEKRKQEEQRLKWEMESLQRRMEDLKKKK